MKKILNFINGEFVESTSKEYLENVSPINGETYSLIPDSDERDVQKALIAAEKRLLTGHKQKLLIEVFFS